MSIDGPKEHIDTDETSNFKSSDFSVQLPSGFRDLSSYTFSLPELGSMPPRISILVERVEKLPDLLRLQEDYLEVFSINATNVTSRGIKSGLYVNRPYSVQTIHWFADSIGFSNMVLFLLEGQDTASCRMATITTSDLVDNRLRSEPIFNTILRGFDFNTD